MRAYGPVRLWGSVAFIAGSLGAGLLLDVIGAARPDLAGGRRHGSDHAAAAWALAPLRRRARERPGDAIVPQEACCAIPPFSPLRPPPA